eukprot:TRINITY_DN9276_c0_g1_i1.p1 TRINITY_DN9276_c0_g1~~TRINITY_DN9276_c0_g1_i1.p1  ORF type:complete len:392 (+),score=97.63 TRINITY_DN9276_c0_g1_i1:85-1176(+)
MAAGGSGRSTAPHAVLRGAELLSEACCASAVTALAGPGGLQVCSAEGAALLRVPAQLLRRAAVVQRNVCVELAAGGGPSEVLFIRAYGPRRRGRFAAALAAAAADAAGRSLGPPPARPRGPPGVRPRAGGRERRAAAPLSAPAFASPKFGPGAAARPRPPRPAAAPRRGRSASLQALRRAALVIRSEALPEAEAAPDTGVLLQLPPARLKTRAAAPPPLPAREADSATRVFFRETEEGSPHPAAAAAARRASLISIAELAEAEALSLSARPDSPLHVAHSPALSATMALQEPPPPLSPVHVRAAADGAQLPVFPPSPSSVGSVRHASSVRSSPRAHRAPRSSPSSPMSSGRRKRVSWSPHPVW